MKPIIAQKPEEVFEEVLGKLKNNPSKLDFFNSGGLIKSIPVKLQEGTILEVKKSIDSLQEEFDTEATVIVAHHADDKKNFFIIIDKISPEDQHAFAERMGVIGAQWFRTLFNFEEDEEAANIGLLGCLIGKEPYPSQKK